MSDVEVTLTFKVSPWKVVTTGFVERYWLGKTTVEGTDDLAVRVVSAEDMWEWIVWPPNGYDSVEEGWAPQFRAASRRFSLTTGTPLSAMWRRLRRAQDLAEAYAAEWVVGKALPACGCGGEV